MSKLDELIQQHCPNGVEYRKLGDTNGCNISTGKGVTKTDIVSDGEYDIVSGGKDPLGKIDIYNREGKNVTIARAGSAGLVLWHEKPFYLNDKCFSIIPKDDSIDTKYLYYTLKNIEDKIIGMKSRGTVPTVNTQHIASIEIPVPPLPVQEEIVRILDKFTELEQELEQELELRKKQYEYYRDKMLSLSLEDYDGEVEEISLGSKDYFISIVGGDVPKDAFSDIQTEEYSIPIYSNGVGDNALYGWTDKVRVDKPCITLSARGTIGYCAYRDVPFYPIVRLIALLPKNINKINAKFLYYAVSALTFVSSKSGIAQLTVPMLDAYKIKLPDIAEQNRIVDVLDKFSTLTSDISEGLPAEIKMRHQQYEYYRDKLLNFKRLEVD